MPCWSHRVFLEANLRGRRARLNQQLNEWQASKGVGVLIERVADETGRRRHLYRIHALPFEGLGLRIEPRFR